MINNETISNVKLTLEQLQQIDVVEQKLAGLNTQVDVATKNLKIIKNDTNRFAREIEAQKPVLESLSTQVEDKNKELNDLIAQKVETQNNLDTLNTEIKVKTAQQAKKDNELQAREDKILAKELELGLKENQLTKITFALDSEKATHNSKVAKLKEVIKEF